jgi:hypothetical protein
VKTLHHTEISPGLLQAASEKRDTRRRRVMSFGLVVPDENHPGLDCTIRDVSDGGARIGFARSVPLPTHFWLIEVRARIVYDVEVAWRNDLEAGLSFRDSFPLSQIAGPGLLFLKRLWMKHATR